jgi:hypothetical protein
MGGERYPAGQLDIKGMEFEITVDDDGEWGAVLDGSRVKAATREQLQAALLRATRQARAKVSIPFLAVEDEWREGRRVKSIRRGTATGLHASSHHVLVIWGDGTKGRYSGHLELAEDTDEGEWRRLYQAMTDARNALTEFERAHKISITKEIKAELSRQLDSGE